MVRRARRFVRGEATLASREHGPDQILAMFEARERDARDMKGH
jgi:hypothetical protein